MAGLHYFSVGTGYFVLLDAHRRLSDRLLNFRGTVLAMHILLVIRRMVFCKSQTSQYCNY